MSYASSLKPTDIIWHCFGCSPEYISSKVILSRNDRLSEYELFLTNVNRFSGVWKGISGSYNGARVTVLVSGKTSSNAGDCVVALKGTPCNSIFAEGTFGAINDSVAIGDFVLLDKALIGEGFSKYFGKKSGYSSANKKISEKSLALLLGYCGGLSVKFHQNAVSFTIDSFLAEDDDFLQSLKQKGVDVIDMESSAVFTAAKHIGADCSFLGWCTDRPMDTSFYSKKQEKYEQTKKRAHASIPKIMLDLVVTNE
ncbi:MAG: hypothetical protein AABW59_05135 [archaeon]